MEIQEIQNRLTQARHKLTTPRKLIAVWISQHKGTFSVSEIRKNLTELDKVTVYRTLELFCSLDLIHGVITLHGEQHFEIHEQKQHHHHIICEGCEKNECVPCEIPTKKIPSFKKIHHSLVFTGLCNSCAT